MQRRPGRAWARTVVALLAAVSGLVLLTPLASPAHADPACSQPPEPQPVLARPGWPQVQYDAPELLWPFSRGAGVTVAVLDTGVDVTHPQLTGKVQAGYDAIRNVPEGNVDCSGHGTAVASIIAGTQVSGVGFFGLAPDVSVFPVRVTDQPVLAPGTQAQNPAFLASGIDAAVAAGSKVVLVSTVVFADDPALAAAVARAVAAGVVVVAAAGNAHDQENLGNSPDPDVLTPYPAAYPGVLGVGAVNQSGQRVAASQIGSYIDLVGPGEAVLAASAGGHAVVSDTGVAAAFVAASAALLLGQTPSLLDTSKPGGAGAAVAARLMATAAPAGGTDAGYGAGLVDPYRAMTETDSAVSPVPPASMSPPPRDPIAERAAAQQARTDTTAVVIVSGLIALLLTAVAALVLLPRARRRRWRPGQSARPVRDDGESPAFVPAEALFAAKDEVVRERR